MKERKLTRIGSVLLAAAVCMLLCLQLAGNNQAAAATPEGDIGIFALRMENKSEYFIYSAFLLYDDVTDRQYILADPVVAKYAEEGYSMTLLAEGYSIEAQCLGDDGYFAYLSASGMQHFRPLLLSETYSEQIYIFIQLMDEKNETPLGEDFVYCDISQWDQEEGAYVSPNKVFNEIIGAPAVKDMSTYEVVGTMGVYDGNTTYYPAESYNFHPVFSVEHQSGERPVPSSEDDSTEIPTAYSALGIGVVILVVVFIVVNQNKKKKPSEDSSAGHSQGTVALDPEPVLNNNFAPLGAVPTSVPSQWQIRGMGGPLDGRIFLLTSTLRIGRGSQNEVVFSGNTPGISGSHCQVSFEHGRVVLRDLQSTYGTFMGGRKLEPQISYNLQNGDTFTLAENAQTFRLEHSGNSVQDMTPAVRSAADGNIYRADMNGCISFGRDPRSQVTFDAATSSVSTNHCILYRENGQLYLKDTNSTNGTFFAEDSRLKPNKPYRVKRGTTFFLVSPQNSFVITED